MEPLVRHSAPKEFDHVDIRAAARLSSVLSNQSIESVQVSLVPDFAMFLPESERA